ncbi:MAG: 6-pyruvoyl trahydropterin synthase family protein [Candidatus Thorarchaeota archaeon]|jgi:6-pyruvoyltetrahydropterin/6-carboxytetrahydropterin synthase
MHSIRVNDQRLHFSSAHFVMGADYCENLHGHNYFVDITVSGPLDSDGMVMDFKDIKKKALRICERLDHKTLLPSKSTSIKVNESEFSYEVTVSGKRYVFPREDCLILPLEATTAERLAEFIASQIELSDRYKVKVCVSESIGSMGCFESEAT